MKRTVCIALVFCLFLIGTSCGTVTEEVSEASYEQANAHLSQAFQEAHTSSETSRPTLSESSLDYSYIELSEAESFGEVPAKGDLPAEISESLLKSEALAIGQAFSGGYLLASPEHGGYVFRYGSDGKLLKRQTLPFGYRPGSVYQLGVTAAKDGYAVRGVYVKGDSYKDGTPAILYCDADGNTVWEHRYNTLLAGGLQEVFVTETGEILTVGISPLKKDAPATDPKLLYLSRLSKDGTLQADAFPFKESNMQLFTAKYVRGVGLLVGYAKNASVGLHANASNTEYILTLFRADTLAQVWSLNVGREIRGIAVKGQRVFAVTKDGVSVCNAKNGTQIAQKDMTDCSMAETDTDVLVVQEKAGDLCILDEDLKTVGSYPYDAGTVKQILPAANGGYLVISEHIKGKLQQAIGSTKYQTEWVYSGYSADGSLLWRKTFDRVN